MTQALVFSACGFFAIARFYRQVSSEISWTVRELCGSDPGPFFHLYTCCLTICLYRIKPMEKLSVILTSFSPRKQGVYQSSSKKADIPSASSNQDA